QKSLPAHVAVDGRSGSGLLARSVWPARSSRSRLGRRCLHALAELALGLGILALAGLGILSIHIWNRQMERTIKLIHVLARTSRMPKRKRKGPHTARDPAASADDRAFTDNHVRQERHVHADATAFPERRTLHAKRANGMRIVGHRNPGSDEDVILNRRK